MKKTQPKILIYTFLNSKDSSYQAVKNLMLPNVKKLYIIGKKGTTKLLSHLEKHNYDHILGLGAFMKSANKIRIDQRFIYLYGKSQIIPVGEETYEPSWVLPLSELSYYSDKGSNGPCNYSAYSVSRYIAENQLSTKFAFAHIPRAMPVDQVEWTINYWLKAIINAAK